MKKSTLPYWTLALLVLAGRLGAQETTPASKNTPKQKNDIHLKVKDFVPATNFKDKDTPEKTLRYLEKNLEKLNASLEKRENFHNERAQRLNEKVEQIQEKIDGLQQTKSRDPQILKTIVNDIGKIKNNITHEKVFNHLEKIRDERRFERLKEHLHNIRDQYIDLKEHYQDYEKEKILTEFKDIHRKVHRLENRLKDNLPSHKPKLKKVVKLLEKADHKLHWHYKKWKESDPGDDSPADPPADSTQENIAENLKNTSTLIAQQGIATDPDTGINRIKIRRRILTHIRKYQQNKMIEDLLRIST